MKPLAPILACLVLAACSPQVQEQSFAAVAVHVVTPMLDDRMTGVEADQAARCITANATLEENQALARDLGVEAGTSTRATVRAILLRPDTRSCLADAGLPQPEV